MKNAFVPSLLALIFSTVALAILIVHGSDSTRPSSSATGPDLEWQARFERLEEENRALRERLDQVENRALPGPVRLPAMEDIVTQAQLAQLREELLLASSSKESLASPSTLGGETPGVASDVPEFKEHVAAALSEIRKQEAVDKTRRYHEDRLERLEETMPKIEGWLELDASQTNAMRAALLAQWEREADLVNRWEAGEDPEVLGELKGSIQQTHRDELAVFLTPEQLETYTSRGRGK